MNIYVSNLGFNMKDEDLKQVFTPYGEVSSAKIIMDKMTNQSRGFGFVEMADNEAAQKAMTELDGSSIDNRNIKVTEARPKNEQSFRGYGGGSGFNNKSSFNKNGY